MTIFKIVKSAWRPASLASLLLAAPLVGARTALCVDIEHVQPVTVSNPLVNGLLQPAPGSPPYSSEFLGFNIQGFLDTGSSGVVISELTAFLLDLPRTPGVVHTDVAIGGETHFDVSPPLTLRISGTNDPDWGNLETYETVYNQVYAPMRLQLGPTDTELSIFDVYGMPAMMGKTVVIDPRQAIPLLLSAPTYIYNPGTPFNEETEYTNPGIPETSHHVQMSYADFDRFTQTIGPDELPADPPQLNHNPFIGPNPLLQLEDNPPPDNTPPVTMSFGGHEARGSFLLDTGGAASFISSRMAASMHIRFVEGTQGTDDPQLEIFDPENPDEPPLPLENQFVVQLQGLAGVVTWAGFYADELVLQTLEGSDDLADPDNIRYRGTPILVEDFSVRDPLTDESLILDGVLGMNYLLDSLFITPDFEILDERESPYNWVTFDEPTGILGLDLVVVPEPGSIAMAGCGLVLLAAYAWRRRQRQK
ncbi:MAG: PEP-CTERM sorting domain-containing protein [Pirellulales bacterium]